MKFEKQDLVHPPDRLEAVQVVLGGLALDVAGLVREVGARRVDSLAPLLQHRRDGALGEPVDLQVGVELAQLVGDRRVSLRVAEADRRRDVERALAPRLAAHPAARRRRRRYEVAEQEVDLDRVAGVRRSGPLPSIVTSSPAVALASSTPRSCGVIASSSPWITSTGQLHPRAELAHRSLRRGSDLAERVISVSASVSSPQPTASSIGFVECGSVTHCEMKNSTKPAVVAEPVVGVELRPALVRVELSR